MRDFASCFSEHAIKVSDSSCSGNSGRSPSAQNTVACVYRTQHSTGKQLLVTVTWCRNQMGHLLSVTVDDDPASCVCKVDTSSWQFWKKKGTRSLETGSSKVDVFWDLSSAKYAAGPEPVENFYLVVVADAQIVVLLGDMDEEAAMKKFDITTPIANFFLSARKEYVSGKAVYSTKAQFVDHGVCHDILIKCRGENGGTKDPELCVCIDQKKVIHVKKLLWKFRGNQTILVDGLPVDMMWDVHGWFFNSSASGDAVFMFKPRKGSDSRLWLEEKLLPKKDLGGPGFSLLIYACKCP
ncbi:hypothetical protein H6P81_003546 [Aristolochia fimbriata]|uniref:Uncharacterized protein n=1 Tax=Aristolochia fimbriata TaxID=158543 RepID=A0AAV7FD30_ARIFI|nr:hypothetical protein H6P81_003546 [Aristolochia fimbriata]